MSRQAASATAGAARDQSQMAVCARNPPELSDPLLFGDVQQPEPDPVEATIHGKGRLRGEGRCDRPSQGAAA